MVLVPVLSKMLREHLRGNVGVNFQICSFDEERWIISHKSTTIIDLKIYYLGSKSPNLKNRVCFDKREFSLSLKACINLN